MPKQTFFFDLFLDIDFVATKIVELLVDFSKDQSNISIYARKAKQLEHAGDSKTHTLIDRLNRTFITPFDREDIYMLAHELDSIIDLIDSVFQDFDLYKITTKVEAIDDFVPLISKASKNMGVLLLCLKTMKLTPEFTAAKIKMHELEDKGDLAYHKAITKLFESEKDALKVIKLKDIISRLEDVMDQYQKLSDIIEGIIVKTS